MAALQNHRSQPLRKRGETRPDAPGEAREGEERGTQVRSRGVKEVSWSVPDGFEVYSRLPMSRPSSMTPWLAAACTCAGRSMAGSLAGLLTLPLTPRPACSKSSTTADYLGRRQQGASKAQCVENYGHGSDAHYKTHGQSYLAQPPAVRCERAVWTLSAGYLHTARGFCHAVYSATLASVIRNYSVYCNYSCYYTWNTALLSQLLVICNRYVTP